MPLRSHVDVVSDLQGQISAVLKPLVDQEADFASTLLDFPDHANVGDSAIYLGEINLLSKSGYPTPTLTHNENVSVEKLSSSLPPGIIFLHGGGNFGDLYPKHQVFREKVVSAIKDRTIIQLPQSIHFEDETRIAGIKKAINQHRDFTMLVRDTQSQEIAGRHFDCPTFLCPDMAFALGTLDRAHPPTHDVLVLLRKDKETSISDPASFDIPREWLIADWPADHPNLKRWTIPATVMEGILTAQPQALTKPVLRRKFYNRLAEERLRRGISLLSKANYVITDRLHGHILCTLLGINHSFLDNSYGKIARFAAAFNTIWEGATQVSSLEEAVATAHASLRAEGRHPGRDHASSNICPAKRHAVLQ